LRGKSSGHIRVDLEAWVRQIASVDPLYFPGVSVSILPVCNEITLHLDWHSRECCRIAAELHGGGVPAMFEWVITCTDVIARWPDVVEELQAEGFWIKPQQQKSAARARPVVAPARNAALPRPRVSDDKVRQWYIKRVKQCGVADEKPSEEKDQAAARDEFGDKVRRNQVRDLRHELAPEEWRRQGRRRNKGTS